MYYGFDSNSKQIYYIADSSDYPSSPLLLIHELAHAELGHIDYQSDLELVLIEIKAWDKALIICQELSIDYDQTLRDSCIKTYLDWYKARGTCPNCHTLNINRQNNYQCYNCLSSWRVSDSLHPEPRKYNLSF
ncbi:hypothetical protein KA531_01930 [Candidatus Saccharibacteria bacterium]|nr:hypothetical protein [Candidatus Saccharibacteria bacterium]